MINNSISLREVLLQIWTWLSGLRLLIKYWLTSCSTVPDCAYYVEYIVISKKEEFFCQVSPETISIHHWDDTIFKIKAANIYIFHLGRSFLLFYQDIDKERVEGVFCHFPPTDTSTRRRESHGSFSAAGLSSRLPIEFFASSQNLEKTNL